jgi:hypothetical protein
VKRLDEPDRDLVQVLHQDLGSPLPRLCQDQARPCHI